MKRILPCMMLLCLILFVKADVQAKEADNSSSYVYDFADILTDDEEAGLNEMAAQISGKYSSGTYIITVDDYLEYADDVNTATQNIYIMLGLGIGEDNNGEVLLLSMSERDYSFTTHGYAANEAFTDYGLEVLKDEFLDDFADDEWYEGFYDYLTKSEELLVCAAEGNPLSKTSSPVYIPASIGFSLLIGIIIAFIVGLILKSQMKSVAVKVEARNYVRSNSVDIYHRTDTFTHSTETRTKIEKSSSSSSGGSGGFSSSSGKF